LEAEVWVDAGELCGTPDRGGADDGVCGEGRECGVCWEARGEDESVSGVFAAENGGDGACWGELCGYVYWESP